MKASAIYRKPYESRNSSHFARPAAIALLVAFGLGFWGGLEMDKRIPTLPLAAFLVALCVTLDLQGDTPAPPQEPQPAMQDASADQYRIGAGDTLQIFVWRNPELSATVPVRPDGKISTPLAENVVAVGKTPS